MHHAYTYTDVHIYICVCVNAYVQHSISFHSHLLCSIICATFYNLNFVVVPLFLKIMM